jgi:cephalosporin hydroxylase
MIETFLDVEATWATFASGEYQTETDGLRTWKMADDLARYERIIAATRPEVIIETGTKFGGSAVWFANFGVDVISIDITGEYSDAARHAHPGIHWLIGDSLDPAVVLAARDLADGRRTMVVLDSEHAAPHVVREIQLYSQLVTPGCYLVVEDGIFDLVDPSLSHLGGARIPAERGPLCAIYQTLAGDTELWERDTAIEQITDRTYHVGGFWVRKPFPAPTCICDRGPVTEHEPVGPIVRYHGDCPDHAEFVAGMATALSADGTVFVRPGSPGERSITEVAPDGEVVYAVTDGGAIDLSAVDGLPDNPYVKAFAEEGVQVAEKAAPKKRTPRKAAKAPEGPQA